MQTTLAQGRAFIARGVRFTNAHETLLWCKKSRDQKKYTFNYHAMKQFNGEKQMRSDWELPLCTGGERLRSNGEKVHATQKPEALLYRVLLSSSQPGDVVLDPFFGTDTTGAVARKLNRRFVGIERKAAYIAAAQTRLATIPAPLSDDEVYGAVASRRTARRIPVAMLLECGLLLPGQTLFFDRRSDQRATLLADGTLCTADGGIGSIHRMGALISGLPTCNGWQHWFFADLNGTLQPIDALREQIRQRSTS